MIRKYYSEVENKMHGIENLCSNSNSYLAQVMVITTEIFHLWGSKKMGQEVVEQRPVVYNSVRNLLTI